MALRGSVWRPCRPVAGNQRARSGEAGATVVATGIGITRPGGRRQQGYLSHLPNAVGEYLRMTLMHCEREVFVAIFLNARYSLIRMEELFAGMLTQTIVYPREVVKRALAHNSAAVVFAHNQYPSCN